MPRKPKLLVRCAIPTIFAEFMQEVHGRIVGGDKAAVSVCSDDLLQCRQIYGGFYAVDRKQYGFRYFHTDKATWDIQLTDMEIASIARHEMTDFDLWQCNNKDCVSLYPSEDSYCPNCDSILHFDMFAERLRKRCPELSDAEINRRASLRAIGIALLDFQDEHGHFPPSRLLAADGTPLHSWRSLILPHLDEEDLFSRIHFDEPWSSEANSKVSAIRPAVYASGTKTRMETHVVAPIGEPTIWPPSGVSKMSDITSGTSYTVAAIQTQRSVQNWMQPTDIDLIDVVAEYRNARGMLAVFVDGHVEYVSDMPELEFQALLCKQSGEY